MFESISIQSSVPVYLQIENQVRFAIARGDLKPGDRLPAVQELAKKLEVNFNTVTKAYRDLEIMGLIFTRRGMGCFVRDDAQQTCVQRCREEIFARVHEVAQEAKAAGMTKKELNDAITAIFRLDGPVYGELPTEIAALAKKKKK